MLLLSLVGEQPIPNLLPLWQSDEYTTAQFAATPTTRGVAESLARTILADPQLQHLRVLDPLMLSAYDIQASRSCLAAALVQHQREGLAVRLNLTGGTKLMSLAAVQAAFGSGVNLLYVSTQENQLIHLASDGAELVRQSLEVQISAGQYLAAHDLEVGDDLSFRPEARRYAVPPPQEGDELEEQVFRQARQSGQFDDVRRNVFIRKQTSRGPVINELDVVVTRNGRLAVCSCKSGKTLTKETIYELASLSRREAAGIYCGKVLVTSQDTVSRALRDRARDMNVHLVYGPEIENVAEHLLLATR